MRFPGEHTSANQRRRFGAQRFSSGADHGLGDAGDPGVLRPFARALALNEVEAKKFKGELEGALAGRAEIREMAGNAVMLTALAVLQHNDQRLPEYRVDLYGSILWWLAAAREHKEGRLADKECLNHMRRLALYMQDAPHGRRLVQVNRRRPPRFWPANLAAVWTLKRIAGARNARQWNHLRRGTI